MVLPTGVNKGSGLAAALHKMQLSPHNAIGIGDAENDHAFLELCECSVAVGNALPAVKDRCDLVMASANGRGVAELISLLLAGNFFPEHSIARHTVTLGTEFDDHPVSLALGEQSILFCGSSGGGKSTTATAVLEQLMEQHYQCVLIDPEGDYEMLREVVTFGSSNEPPEESNIYQALCDPDQNIVVNLLAIPLKDRPAFFRRTYSVLQEMRERIGRPHSLFLDEAHHLLPPGGDSIIDLKGTVVITVTPNSLHRDVLDAIDVVIATRGEAIRNFCDLVGEPAPYLDESASGDEFLLWQRRVRGAPKRFRPAVPHAVCIRHRRKYAEGELPSDRSFYFREDSQLNLRAPNLTRFVELAEGVDDATWKYHLSRNDYSRWVRYSLKTVYSLTRSSRSSVPLLMPARLAK